MTKVISTPRYLGWFVGLSFLLPLLITGINALLGVDLTSGATSVIPVFIAAMVEGTSFAKANRREPAASENWAAARKMLLLIIVASAIMLLPVILIAPDILTDLTRDRQFLMIVAGVAVIFMIIAFFTSWFFFRMGARNHMKSIGSQR